MDPLLLARKILQEMVREQAEPTPENYRVYYERVMGVTAVKKLDAQAQRASEAGVKALQAIHHKIPNHPAAARWKKAIDQAIQKQDWYDMEVLLVRTMQQTVDQAMHRESALNEPLQDHSKLFNGMVHIMDSFLRNLLKLFPSNAAVIAQVDVLRQLLEKPDDPDRQLLVKRALAKLRVPENLDARIRAEKEMAKELAHQFLDQMNVAGSEANSLADSMAAHLNDLSSATDRDTLMKVTKAMVDVTSASRQRLAASSKVLQQTASRAQEAEAKLNSLEEAVTKAAEASRDSFTNMLLANRGLAPDMHQLFNETMAEISVVALNVDDYRDVVTGRGQDAANKALNHLAKVIESHLETGCMAARLSDDEFVILFPDKKAEALRTDVQAMQRNLTKRFFLENKARGIITFSAGIAERRLDSESLDDVLKRAEDAMCDAQSKGKNYVEVAGF